MVQPQVLPTLHQELVVPLVTATDRDTLRLTQRFQHQHLEVTHKVIQCAGGQGHTECWKSNNVTQNAGGQMLSYRMLEVK